MKGSIYFLIACMGLVFLFSCTKEDPFNAEGVESAENPISTNSYNHPFLNGGSHWSLGSSDCYVPQPLSLQVLPLKSFKE